MENQRSILRISPLGLQSPDVSGGAINWHRRETEFLTGEFSMSNQNELGGYVRRGLDGLDVCADRGRDSAAMAGSVDTAAVQYIRPSDPTGALLGCREGRKHTLLVRPNRCWS